MPSGCEKLLTEQVHPSINGMAPSVRMLVGAVACNLSIDRQILDTSTAVEHKVHCSAHLELDGFHLGSLKLQACISAPVGADGTCTQLFAETCALKYRPYTCIVRHSVALTLRR